MNEDFRDMLRALLESGARFLVVGAPVGMLEVMQEDLAKPDVVVQIGLPPRRVDILTDLTGIDFAGAWADQVGVEVGDMEVPFIGRASLIQNKRARGRLKDLADLEALGETP